MKVGRDLDAFLTFFAGVGTGAVLMRWYLGPVRPPFPAPSADIARQGATAVSLGRIHSLLGEIRGLMKSRGRGAVGSLRSGGEISSGPDLGRAEDTWRRPDRIGYGRSPGLPRFRVDGRKGVFLLAAAGAVAAIVTLRRGGADAAP